MDETRYLALADEAFRKVEAALDDVDADDVDCERSGDVLTLTFKDGRRCVLNTQRPTRQLWLAANARAWHFSYDEAAGAWRDDKGAGLELFSTLTRILAEQAGVQITLQA